MRVCGSDLGLTAGGRRPADGRRTSTRHVLVLRGTPESHLGPFLITPFGEEFTASVPGDVLAFSQTDTLNVAAVGPVPGRGPQSHGLMLINNSDFRRHGNTGGATRATESDCCCPGGDRVTLTPFLTGRQYSKAPAGNRGGFFFRLAS